MLIEARAAAGLTLAASSSALARMSAPGMMMVPPSTTAVRPAKRPSGRRLRRRRGGRPSRQARATPSGCPGSGPRSRRRRRNRAPTGAAASFGAAARCRKPQQGVEVACRSRPRAPAASRRRAPRRSSPAAGRCPGTATMARSLLTRMPGQVGGVDAVPGRFERRVSGRHLRLAGCPDADHGGVQERQDLFQAHREPCHPTGWLVRPPPGPPGGRGYRPE